MRSRFVVATANLQNTAPDMRRAEVRRAAEQLGAVADIIGFQEIREAEDVVDIRRGLRDKGSFDLVKTSTSTPIAVRTDYFRVTDTRVHVFNQASGRVPTPRRQAVEATTERRRRISHPPMAVFNAHPINGAFNDNHLDTKEVRRLIWDHSFGVFKSAVVDAYARGENIVIVGDMNCKEMAKFLPKQDWIFNGGIDKIAVISQPGWKFDLLERWEQENASDHDALLAHLSLHRRR